MMNYSDLDHQNADDLKSRLAHQTRRMKVDNFDPRKQQIARTGVSDSGKTRPRSRLGGKAYFRRKTKATTGLRP